MWWERTGISGYSRDLMEASGGLALFGGSVNAAVTLRVDSRSVAGFGRETILLPACSLSLDLSSLAALEVEGGIRRRDGPVRAAIMARGKGSFLVLTFRRDEWGGSAAAGGSFDVTGGLSFLAGYDLETGETSGGLSVRGRIPAAVSWSMHPVLGTTFSVSVGAVR
jgi:hypothetical protein